MANSCSAVQPGADRFSYPLSVYRGQVIPADCEVTVETVVTAVDEARRTIRADGTLSVDGRVIYGMKEFTLRQNGG